MNYLTSTVNDRELYRRLALFGQCSSRARAAMFLATVRNDSRSMAGDGAAKMVTAASRSERPAEAIVDRLRADGFLADGLLARLRNIAAGMRGGDWLQGLGAVMETAHEAARENPWLQSVLVNMALVGAGLCPLIHFAFGRWQGLSLGRRTLESARARWLVELAPLYLYRLAPGIGENALRGREVGRGAYSSIWEVVGSDGAVVVKAPRNLAGEVMAGQEWEVHEALARTPLRHNVPNLVEYDKTTGAIKREFVKGKLGHQLLVDRQLERGGARVGKLKSTYQAIVSAMRKKNVRLDIHPSNFVWDECRERWVLIDLGPVPVIGFDYYPLSSFAEYWRKVWAERLERMRTEPIRSVDLGL